MPNTIMAAETGHLTMQQGNKRKQKFQNKSLKLLLLHIIELSERWNVTIILAKQVDKMSTYKINHFTSKNLIRKMKEKKLDSIAIKSI